MKGWRDEGWRKWRRERWVEISIKRWNWFMKWNGSLFQRWGEAYWKEQFVMFVEEAADGQASATDNIRGTSIIVSLKREIRFCRFIVWWWKLWNIDRRNQFVLYACSIFSQWRDLWTGVIRPPDIVCRRTYILPVFLLLSFFFFSPPNLRGRWTQLNKNRPHGRK